MEEKERDQLVKEITESVTNKMFQLLNNQTDTYIDQLRKTQNILSTVLNENLPFDDKFKRELLKTLLEEVKKTISLHEVTNRK